MSDISDNGAFNAALLNSAAGNYGPNAVASQANTNANTQLTQQQALAAQIQNANARWQFTQLQNAAAAVHSGQNGPTVDTSNGTNPQGFPLPKSSGGSVAESGGGDKSGASAPLRSGASSVVPSSSTPAAQPAQVSQPNDQASDDQQSQPRDTALSPTQSVPAQGGPISPEDALGSSAADDAKVQSTLDSQFNVDPAGSPAEQHAIAEASMQAAQTKLFEKSGPYGAGLSAAADAKVQALQAIRTQNVTDKQNANSLYASQEYDKMEAIKSAHKDGRSFETLEAIAPISAALIKKKNPEATPEELNDIAADTAAHWGAYLHRFTNRPVKVGDDGATYDEVTGMRVDGVPIRGVDPKQQAELLNQANTLKTIKNSDGTETTKTQAEWDGYDNPNLWVTHAVSQIQSRNNSNNQLTSAAIHAAQFGHLQPGAPPVPGGTLYRPPQQGSPGQPGAAPQPGQQPQPGAPQPNAAPPGAPQPGAASQPGAPGAQPGQQPQQKDNGLLPGINPDALPKIQTAPVKQGTSQSPGDLKTSEGIATARLEQMKTANDGYIEAQKTGALLTAAKREAAQLANNPRMAGPGSELAQGIAKLKAAVSGQPPDALVDLGSLDKILLQMGAQNIRGALSGQRITNQEFMKMLTEGNPNTEMPLATINKLLGYLGAQNDYDQRFNRTKTVALNRGANPLTVDSDIGAQADRGDYVESRVGVRPPISGQSSGGQQGGGAAPAAALQYLAQHPEASTAFKSKYGYLPNGR